MFAIQFAAVAVLSLGLCAGCYYAGVAFARRRTEAGAASVAIALVCGLGIWMVTHG